MYLFIILYQYIISYQYIILYHIIILYYFLKLIIISFSNLFFTNCFFYILIIIYLVIVSGSIKEIHVIRGLVLDTERCEPIIVSAKQFFIEKHKSESKDPERYIKKMIETKKYFFKEQKQTRRQQ